MLRVLVGWAGSRLASSDRTGTRMRERCLRDFELMAYSDKNRRIAISTPLGKDVCCCRRVHGSEAISKLFSTSISRPVFGKRFHQVPGCGGKERHTLRIFDAEGGERAIGMVFISRYSQGALDDQSDRVTTQTVPSLWFLTRTADCRIFREPERSGHYPRRFSATCTFTILNSVCMATYTPRITACNTGKRISTSFRD